MSIDEIYTNSKHSSLEVVIFYQDSTALFYFDVCELWACHISYVATFLYVSPSAKRRSRAR